MKPECFCRTAGDPRMDAGADRDCRTAAELVAGGAAPQALSDAQIIGVMDRLAACEAAWHAGHFLPQSVYTCLYMLLPDRCHCSGPATTHEATGLCERGRSSVRC